MILKKIKEILAEQLNIDTSEITEDTSLRGDLEIDSLDMVEVILAIEEEYDIQIDDDVLEDMSTVGDAVDYIEANIQQ